MEAAKKVRAAHRTAFTKVLNQLNNRLAREPLNRDEIEVIFELLQEKMAELECSSAKVLDITLTEGDEALYDNESADSDEYKIKFLTVKSKVRKLLMPRPVHVPIPNVSENRTPAAVYRSKPYKMPKIEFVKFNENARDWLQFWNQFRKVHENPEFDDEDKFDYLIQSTEVGSRARDLVTSYPPTRENYQKAIDTLKNRFGRDDLQIEVYMRELLNLVLKNAVSEQKEKPALASLYDKLETHMRALETLGVTTDKCAAMLLPLVESSLPEELLRAWQRSSKSDGITDAKERLTKLMAFLGAEVEGDERISMAVSGFSLSAESEKSKHSHAKANKAIRDLPTAMELLTTRDEKKACIFCSNTNHDSSDCFKAKKMSLSERREMVKNASCCFNCLKKGHSYKKCKSRVKCAWCEKRHVLIMCPVSSKAETDCDKSTADSSEKKEHNLTSFDHAPEVYLQTLRVRVVNGDKQCIARALMDSGSQSSYITTDIAARLDYKASGTREMCHTLFGGMKTDVLKHNIYRVHLRSPDDSYACNFQVMDKKAICGNIPIIRSADSLRELCEKRIFVSDVGHVNETIDILIGADVFGKLLTGKKCDLKNGLTAVETHLGWVVSGKDPETSTHSREDAVTATHSMFVQSASVSDLWRLEVLGIEDPTQRKPKEEREVEVKRFFEETTVINSNGRYEIMLPWKPDHAPISSNRGLAEQRLEGTLKKLKKIGLTKEYDDILTEWEQDGVIEIVPEDELAKPSHYLPHHPVIKMQSNTTKIRPVFDAAAHEKNSPSLNECLETGPNLIELLPSMLLGFREKDIGAIADIKRAYLQISVAPQERDYLRFIWIRNGQIIVYRHKRVVFGFTSSSFLLGATIDLHLNKVAKGDIASHVKTEIIQKLRKCFYSDNCVLSLETMEELDMFVKQATDVMKIAGFELRGWEYTGDGKNRETTVLGVLWDKEQDTLSVNLSFLTDVEDGYVTKRKMLSVTQRIFDPIGYTCPVTLIPKLLVQKTWKTNCTWDDKLDCETQAQFTKWVQELSLLENIKIPRKIGNMHEPHRVSFHAFADASGLAYAAAVYVRVEYADKVEVQMIGAKCRVAPTKEMTIPRLELLAATITARLAVSLVSTLNLEDAEIIYWSDSTTVISWINRQAQWNTFVCNRVQEIQKLTSSATWRHVPGTMNPADLPSRGCTASQLIASRWWEGPPWLRLPRTDWPTTEIRVDEEEVNKEMKKSAVSPTTMINRDFINNSVKLSMYFSSYKRIVRLIAWIIRYYTNSRIKQKSSRNLDKTLAFDELRNAETLLLRIIQSEMFVEKNDKKLKSLNTFTDENGLIRVKTKIFYRNDSKSFRCPVVLDSKHLIVQRMLEEKHRDLGHAGVQIMLCHSREDYWLLSARQTIRSIVSKCMRCKRYDAKRLEAADVPLPIDRVRDACIFEITSVDLAGPVYLKEGKKAWICLFTCAVFRAVHLELLTSLSEACFMKALQRFIARRGRPLVVF